MFTGNELGALLGWWALQCLKFQSPDIDLKECYMLASTVSSKMLRSMAKVEGFNFVETLTGFKWMGNKSYELINDGKMVLFAFEEAIGFMFAPTVLDKDGVSAAFHLASLAAFLKTNKQTLFGKLQELYERYGFHYTSNSYFLCYEPDIIAKIFERIRNFQHAPNTVSDELSSSSSSMPPALSMFHSETTKLMFYFIYVLFSVFLCAAFTSQYPGHVHNGKYAISTVRDLTTGIDTCQKDGKALLPPSKSSQMVTFTFENGAVITLRTSGTEPKIKYYAEMCASSTEKYANYSYAICNLHLCFRRKLLTLCLFVLCV